MDWLRKFGRMLRLGAESICLFPDVEAFNRFPKNKSWERKRCEPGKTFAADANALRGDWQRVDDYISKAIRQFEEENETPGGTGD